MRQKKTRPSLLWDWTTELGNDLPNRRPQKGERMGGRQNITFAWGAVCLLSLLHARQASAAFCIKLPKATNNVQVRVVAVLASEAPGEVDPKLKCLAKEIQKRHPKLKSFKIATMTCKSVPEQGTETFKLVVDQQAIVTILERIDKKKCVRLKVIPPTIGEITYTTKCKMYFPIMTRYKTKKGEQLILAISVQPCTKK